MIDLSKTLVIGRADASGLGRMTVEFCRHMKPGRVAVLDYHGRGRTNPDLIPGCHLINPASMANHHLLAELMNGMTTVIGFETFYNPAVVARAKVDGLRTILFPMWECSPPWSEDADNLICLSDRDLRAYPRGLRMDWPIDRRAFLANGFPMRPTFLHNAGSHGYYGRNGTEFVLKALNQCGDLPCDFRLRTLEAIPSDWFRPPHVVIEQGDVPIDRLYLGTVFVFPMRFEGLSLPISEAAALGLPTIVLDLPEWSRWPQELRARVGGTVEHSIGARRVKYAIPDVDHMASIIRRVASHSIEAKAPPPPPTWDEFAKEFINV